MTLVVNDECVGVPARAWRSSRRVARTPVLGVARPRRVVLVAPHPDDEVLGAGGLMQKLAAAAVPLHILAVTDGEASHPRSKVAAALDLGAVRAGESVKALHRLGCSEASITRLRIPDGRIGENAGRLEEVIAAWLGPEDICVAPWSRDGHPDHDACGEAASMVAGQCGARLLSYLVWALHWADPVGSDLPWAECRRIVLSPPEVARKRWATGAFRSQIRALGPSPDDAPVLPAPVLRRFWLGHELYLDAVPSI